MTNPPQPPPPGPQDQPGPYGAPPGAPGPQPPADAMAAWGLKESPSRPKRVTQVTQLLWAVVGLSALLLLFAFAATLSAPLWISTGYLVSGSVAGLIFNGGAAVALAWFITRERLGVFGAADPRVPVGVGLGLIGLFTLGGLWGGWGWYAAISGLIGLARLAAVGMACYLLFQPDVEQWLKSRPGNRPKPPRHPGGYTQNPPAAGTQVPPGYPNEM